MTQITIYLNYSDLLDEGEAEQRITTIADYVPVYRAIARALLEDETLTVSIERDARVCEAWLQRMAEQRGEQHFAFKDVDPRTRLAERWGVEVPDWVNDWDILRANLLDPSVSARPGERFADTVLRYVYSPHLTYDRLPLHQLVELLADLKQHQDGDKPRLLQRILRRRLDAWAQAAASEGERHLMQLLRRDPERVRTLLTQVKVLQDYPPNVVERVIGERAADLLALDLELVDLDIGAADLGAALDQIRVHLNKMKQREASVALVETLLDQVSGELEVEFQTLYELLTERDIALDRELVARVQQRFAPLREQIADQMERLKLYVPPKRPSHPNPQDEWAMADWLHWAVEEYFPYRFWLEETEQRDTEVEGFAVRYADWLYEHYEALLPTFHQMIYRALHNEAQLAYLTGSKPVLFIALDNFNYKFLDHLQRRFEKAGFYTAETKPYLAMLPTCTEVGKKCLFTGSPAPFEATAYEQPILEAWNDRLKGRRLRYVPHLGELAEIPEPRPDVTFLNYTLVDETLHQSTIKLGVSHAKEIRRRLNDLVDAIREFARRSDAERELVVIVGSDHGSTRIPADVPNIIDQAFYTERLEDPHHRYIAVDDAALAQLPDNVDFECYRLRKGVLDLNANYLVARGYGRFKKTDETTYVHGGLTPEESIVPLCVFEPVEEKPKPLTVRLLEDEFRYGAKATLHLELVNVNPYPCMDLRVDVLDAHIDAEPFHLDSLLGREDATVDMPIRIWRREDEVTTIQLKISYQILGERKRRLETLPITMRSMMESSFDLEDLD